MQRTCLLAGMLVTLGNLGCAAWRQPAPPAAERGNPTMTDADIQAALPPMPAVETHTPVPTAVIQASYSTAAPAQQALPGQDLLPSSPRDKLGIGGRNDEPVNDPLALFSEALSRGDKLSAANHLEEYVRLHPEQIMFRFQLAELLIQSKSDARAKIHFEQFVAGAQTAPESVRKYLVHAHTRLMEIAQRSDDSFTEMFHRGVGLLILVQEQDRNSTRDDTFCEEMLCKSMKALTNAKDQKPSDPRVHVYLAEVYERMSNRRASGNERSAARNGVIPGELTAAERALVSIVPGPLSYVIR